MLSGTLPQKIAPLFGIEQGVLDTADWVIVENEWGQVEKCRIWSYWIAQIHYFEFFTRFISPVEHKGAFEALTITIVHTAKGKKGLLLIPPIQEPLNREIGGQKPMKPLDLGNWDDPVAKMLQSINLFPEKNRARHGTTSYEFTLKIRTGNTLDVESHMIGPGADDGDKLLEAILKTVWHLVDIYDDDEMREFIHYYQP